LCGNKNITPNPQVRGSPIISLGRKHMGCVTSFLILAHVFPPLSRALYFTS